MNKIVEKEYFSEKVAKLVVEAPLIARSRRPGHFVIVRTGEHGERIPLTIADADIEKAVKEAAEFEAQDKKRKEAVDARNDADAMVFQTEKAMQEVGDKIDANDKAAVEADLAALKSLIEASANAEEMTDSQIDEMKAAKEKLMESAQKVFAKMYEQAQAAGAGQAGPDMSGADMGAGSSANDDVVDGDYREV